MKKTIRMSTWFVRLVYRCIPKSIMNGLIDNYYDYYYCCCYYLLFLYFGIIQIDKDNVLPYLK